MYKLIYFLRNSYVTILFLVIEIIAISRYAHSNEYTRSRLLSLSSAVTGKAQSVVHDVSSYFMLRSENAQLTRRVAQLENVLSRYRETVDDTSIEVDSTWFGGFQYMTARVVSTSVTRRDNLIVLNRGLRDGVSADMAVLAPNGMIAGYVVNCSERYSVAVSILSSAFKTSGKLYNDSYSGLIEWDGRNAAHVMLRNLSKYAPLKVGAPVYTTGFSHYFPAGMPIGRIESYRLNALGTTYDAVVRLATDMSRLYNVVLVRNVNQEEIQQVEDETRQLLKQPQ